MELNEKVIEELKIKLNVSDAQIKTVLENLGAVALMSGSGATVFGLVCDNKEAEKILEALKIYSWNSWSVSSFDIQY